MPTWHGARSGPDARRSTERPRLRFAATAAASVLLAAGLGTPIAPANAASGVDQPISSEEILKRSEPWLERDVPYSQTDYAPDENGKPYRTDCSGYVSLAWHTGTSHNTSTLPDITKEVDWPDLMPGDAILQEGTHVVLFVRWTDAGDMLIREQANSNDDMQQSVRTVAELAGKGFRPIRYDKVQLVTPEVARDEISANLPEYAVRMQPPNGETFVNFDTIFYTDAKSWHTTVDMVNGTVPVEVWADPVRFDWDFGDGKGETSEDPGARYPDQTVTHRYGERETFRPSVTITWGNLRYRLPNEDEIHTLDDEPTTTAPAGEITAIEADGVLGDGPSPNDGN